MDFRPRYTVENGRLVVANKGRQRASQPLPQPALNQDVLTNQGDKPLEATRKRGTDLVSEASSENSDQEPKFPHKASKGRKGGKSNSKASGNRKSRVSNVDLLEPEGDSIPRTASTNPITLRGDASQSQQAQPPSNADIDPQRSGSPRVTTLNATIFAYFDVSRRQFYLDLTTKPPLMQCLRDGEFETVTDTICPERKPIREMRQIDKINDVLAEIDRSLPMYVAATALSSRERELQVSFEDKQTQVLVAREMPVDIQGLAIAEERGWLRSG